MVEPGENWLYERYGTRPGWQLPLGWATKIPQEQQLVLTYTSSGKKCAPVWGERVKLRSLVLVPTEAPLPEHADFVHDDATQRLSYSAFIRLMHKEVHAWQAIGQAKRKLTKISSIKEDDEADSDTGDPNGSDSESDSVSHFVDKEGVFHEDDVPPDFKPADIGERLAYDLIEHCRKDFLSMMDDDVDLEQVLQFEWDRFLKLSKEGIARNSQMEDGLKHLGNIFNKLDW